MTLTVTSQLGVAKPSSVMVCALSGFPVQELFEASRTQPELGRRGH